MIGVMAIDPGGHTGVAWGVFDERADTVSTAVRKRSEPTGSFTYDQATVEEQGMKVATLWRDFYGRCLQEGLAPEDVYMVMESFLMGPGTPPGDDVMWATRVAWFVWGYRLGQAAEYERQDDLPPLSPLGIIWQQPSLAMGYATDDRLKRWGVWIKGKDHERAAWRHILYFLNGQIQ